MFDREAEAAMTTIKFTNDLALIGLADQLVVLGQKSALARPDLVALLPPGLSAVWEAMLGALVPGDAMAATSTWVVRPSGGPGGLEGVVRIGAPEDHGRAGAAGVIEQGKRTEGAPGTWEVSPLPSEVAERRDIRAANPGPAHAARRTCRSRDRDTNQGAHTRNRRARSTKQAAWAVRNRSHS